MLQSYTALKSLAITRKSNKHDEIQSEITLLNCTQKCSELVTRYHFMGNPWATTVITIRQKRYRVSDDVCRCLTPPTGEFGYLSPAHMRFSCIRGMILRCLWAQAPFS